MISTPQSNPPTELDARRELASNFRLESPVARGATAFVYRARDRADRPVVVTAIARSACHALAGEEALRRAGEATVDLDHPGIIPLCGWGATPGFLWYSTQDVGGRSLADVLHDAGRVPVKACLHIVGEVGSVLQYAHARSASHGGLTTASVIVQPSDRVLVADFCVAALLAGGDPTPAGDQYALAALAHECITGATAPCDGPLTLRDPPPGVPSHLWEALRRALRADAAERFPTVRDFIAAACNPEPAPRTLWLSRGLPRPSAAPPIIFDFEPERPRVARRVALAVLGLALATAGVWLASSPARGTRTALAEPAAPAPPPRETTLPPAPAPAPTLPRPRPPRPLGRLSINASPWGVVFVDGREVGNTPVLDLALAPGPHRVRVERPGFQAAERLVQVEPRKAVRVTDIVLREVTP